MMHIMNCRLFTGMRSIPNECGEKNLMDVIQGGKLSLGSLQVPTAKGRYIVAHETVASTKLLSDILSDRFSQYRFPAGEDTPRTRVLDNSKVRLPADTMS